MPERFLEGRTALVTGSVQGIGLAIGKALASAGARLAVHGLATRQQASSRPPVPVGNLIRLAERSDSRAEGSARRSGH